MREEASGVRRRAANAISMVGALQVFSALVLGLAVALWWGALPARACTNCETIDAPPSTSLTLNGTDRVATYTLSVTVNNLGALGWNVTITSTQFTTGGAPTRTLAANASTITGVTQQCTAGNICVTNPTNNIAYPVAVPAGSPAPTAVKFYDATAVTGVGVFTLTTTVTVAVPANTYAGAYTSTLTLAYATGP